MRGRTFVLLALMLTLVVAAACTGNRVSRAPSATPAPTKTLRPTFTPTPVKPTLTPSPTAALPTPVVEVPAQQPTPVPPTPEPPTPAPTPTPQPQASFTVTGATLNVRSGPGTNYGVIGQIRQGQTFPITGKNPAGNWWQFDYNGRPGWVSGQLVRVANAQLVQVATNIPAPPTARPQPTAPPRPPAQPTSPPPPAAPPTRFGIINATVIENTNDIVTVYCLVLNRAQTAVVSGTLRVLRDGTPVGERAFPALSSWFLQFPVNDNCKVEITPAINGTYTAVLVEGGQPISDPYSFTVTGIRNRTAIIGWKEK